MTERMTRSQERLSKDISEAPPLRRFSVLLNSGPRGLWSLFSTILALVAALVAVFADKSPVHSVMQLLHPMLNSILNLVVGASAAAEVVSAPPSAVPVKTMIVGVMVIIVALFFFWSLLTLSLSKSQKAVDVAQEAVKTLLGFFIGAITGFLG